MAREPRTKMVRVAFGSTSNQTETLWISSWTSAFRQHSCQCAWCGAPSPPAKQGACQNAENLFAPEHLTDVHSHPLCAIIARQYPSTAKGRHDDQRTNGS